MWELDYKEVWMQKNWCFQTGVLEKILESPLDCKEIKPINPKGSQLWIFIGKTCWGWRSNIWSSDVKSQLSGKDPGAGKDWGQEKKGMAEDGMVGWHDQFNGHEFEQTLGSSKWQERLVCYTPWGFEKNQTQLSDWTTTQYQLNTRKKK